MNKVTDYIRTEWKYWVAALLVIIGITAQPHVEASPVPRYTAGEFSILSDWDANTWYVKYGKSLLDLAQPYEDVKVVWTGTHKGGSIILLSGQQGRMCEMNFRLFFNDKNGNVVEDSDFHTCYAEHVSVRIINNSLVVKMDGVVRYIHLW